jgi:hypothetical protein
MMKTRNPSWPYTFASERVLSPAHFRWFMGLPLEWDACAPTATRSTRGLRKPSSNQ